MEITILKFKAKAYRSLQLPIGQYYVVSLGSYGGDFADSVSIADEMKYTQ